MLKLCEGRLALGDGGRFVVLVEFDSVEGVELLESV